MDRFEQGDYAAAIPLLRRALNIAPRDPRLRFDLAVALQETGQLNDAILQYGKALESEPRLAEAHNNIGLALQAQGRFEEAATAHQRALSVHPAYPGAHNNHGCALLGSGRPSAAASAFEAAISLAPDYAEAHRNLGTALTRLRRLQAAIACCDKALSLKPGYAAAHYSRAAALRAAGRIEEATVSFRQAVAVEPRDAATLCELVDYLRMQCDWRGLADLEARLIAEAQAGATVLPFPLLSVADDPALHRDCAQRYARAAGRGTQALASPVRRERERIRLGYLSADFGEHPVARLVAELFELHDRDRFEVIGYSIGERPDSALRRRIMAAFDRFTDLRELSDADAAQLIAADGIDILLDLTGHTSHARLRILSSRPAPIQVNYPGYPGTMGAEFIDYIIVDRFVVPAQHEPFFTERLVHLPYCYQPNDSKRPRPADSPSVPSRASCGLPERGFVFCCFNATYKLAPVTFDIWMRLLDAVPDSVLWLLDLFGCEKDNLRREAAARGMTPGRLIFAPRVGQAEHLARHALADLFLDTLPYNAHTTASDALWCGVPVVTCAGRSFASRVAGSLLHAVGLPELVTHSLEEYEATALRLARSPDELTDLRRRLESNRTTAPLFDSVRYTRAIERAFRQIWRIHAAGEAPRSFAVPDE